MLPELEDDLDGLLPDLVREIVVLGVGGSRQGEVLPDQDPVGVAEVEELMIFIDIPAPTADHVAVQVHDHPESLCQVVLIPAVESVQGHPVRAPHEDLFLVDQEDEFARVVFGRGLRADQIGGPDADLLSFFIQDRLFFVQDPDRRLIQDRLAVAPGPPEFDFVQRQPMPAAMIVQLKGTVVHCFRAPFEGDLHGQPVQGEPV